LKVAAKLRALQMGPLWAGKLLVTRLRYGGSYSRLRKSPSSNLLRHFIETRPQIEGLVLAPFVSARWTADERFDALEAHCRIAERLGSPFDVRDDDEREVIRFDGLEPLTRATLVTRWWRMREGMLTLNLADDSNSIYSLSFVFAEEPAGLVALIGGMQGNDAPDANDLYRQLTKTAHGMRPRDLLIEVFRTMCGEIGVVRIGAVSDAARHQQSRYSLSRHRGTDPVETRYDQVWSDRGGSLREDGFFDLPVVKARRADADVPANKRAMYRRRYAMLDDIALRLRENFAAR
jgi:uncharacterized protein